MDTEEMRMDRNSSNQKENVIDEWTNAMLKDFPVHCSYRTARLEQPTLHSHRGYELYLCIQGKGQFIIGERSYPLGVGTFTVVEPQTLHLSSPFKNVPFHRYILAVEGSYVEQMLVENRASLMTMSQWLPDADSDSFHMQLNASQLLHLQDILVQLERELKRKQPYYPMIVKSLLMQMFAQLGRYHSQLSDAMRVGNGTHKRMVEGIISYMMEHYDQPVSAEELCGQFHVSRSTLFRLIKRHTGVTMNEFLVTIRMKKAKELLQETDLPITEVAASVGFQDISHFCHTFKRLSSMTPSGYRSIHLEKWS
jgi:AraC-like DNA-binding protein/mannose-6-phosphate isomerase-like protein (cupin superfamily)